MKIVLRVALAILIIVAVIWSIEHREDDAERHQERERIRNGLSGAHEVALPVSAF